MERSGTVVNSSDLLYRECSGEMDMRRKWTNEKPTQPGAYWVRGYEITDRSEAALVEIRSMHGVLCSNIHAQNTDADDFSPIEKMTDRIEWCGPLMRA